MRVVVVEGPEPIITPADVPGDHDGNDVHVAAMIAAAQAEIDGPTGWLGRALGVQTIECHADGWPCEVPYRPLLGLVSATVGGEVVEGVKLRGDGRLVVPSGAPSGEIVIRYRAGYDGSATGKVPANARMAVVMMVQNLALGSDADGGLRSFDVDGGFSETYNSPDQMQRLRTSAVESLLSPLRVFS